MESVYEQSIFNVVVTLKGRSSEAKASQLQAPEKTVLLMITVAQKKSLNR